MEPTAGKPTSRWPAAAARQLSLRTPVGSPGADLRRPGGTMSMVGGGGTWVEQNHRCLDRGDGAGEMLPRKSTQ
jgi:hypothetical protein